MRSLLCSISVDPRFIFVHDKGERRIPDIHSSFVVSTIQIAFINNEYLVSINTCYCIQIRTKNNQ